MKFCRVEIDLGLHKFGVAPAQRDRYFAVVVLFQYTNHLFGTRTEISTTSPIESCTGSSTRDA